MQKGERLFGGSTGSISDFVLLRIQRQLDESNFCVIVVVLVLDIEVDGKLVSNASEVVIGNVS